MGMTNRRGNNFNGCRVVSWALCMIATIPKRNIQLIVKKEKRTEKVVKWNGIITEWETRYWMLLYLACTRNSNPHPYNILYTIAQCQPIYRASYMLIHLDNSKMFVNNDTTKYINWIHQLSEWHITSMIWNPPPKYIWQMITSQHTLVKYTKC